MQRAHFKKHRWKSCNGFLQCDSVVNGKNLGPCISFLRLPDCIICWQDRKETCGRYPTHSWWFHTFSNKYSNRNVSDYHLQIFSSSVSLLTFHVWALPMCGECDNFLKSSLQHLSDSFFQKEERKKDDSSFRIWLLYTSPERSAQFQPQIDWISIFLSSRFRQKASEGRNCYFLAHHNCKIS